MSAKNQRDLAAELVRLSRQNANLRREVARLQVYRAMAYRDPLTALWNRRFFEERLREELSRSHRAGPERRFSVMVVDINDFKATNDRHGHPVGDAVLKDVGEFLATHLRTHDVACRTGGDEFGVLLPDLSAADCGQLVNRLRDGLRRLNASRRIPIGLSFGTASWPDGGNSFDALLTRADDAMYADKRSQKTRVLPVAPGRRETRPAGSSRRLATRKHRAAASM